MGAGVGGGGEDTGGGDGGGGDPCALSNHRARRVSKTFVPVSDHSF